ncbi:MAG TPA: DUF2156 domain-containing protein [Oculatellaceae cyanobacterium]
MSHQDLIAEAPSVQTAERMKYLRLYGTNSLAYSSFQVGMKSYGELGCGYIAFVPIGKETPLCLADPICENSNVEHLLKAFVCRYDYPIFIGVSKPVATVLSGMGFLVNEIGMENIINLRQFALSGGDKAFLRSQKNRAAKDGLVVKEMSCLEAGLERMHSVSDEWMRSKVVSSKEMSFIVRPVVYADEPDVRKLFAFRQDELVGFGVFDPMYRDGAVIGYLANALRFVGKQHYSVADTIIMEGIRLFKQEQREILSLGFLPLYKVEDGEEFSHSVLLEWIFRYLYEHANTLYEFKDLAFHKNRYRPGTAGCNAIKVYCAYKRPIRFHLLPSIFAAFGVSFIDQLKVELLHYLCSKVTSTEEREPPLLPQDQPHSVPAQRA